jgi:NTP pyrophosphatase (non-canonical NTP hydrolase)
MPGACAMTELPPGKGSNGSETKPPPHRSPTSSPYAALAGSGMDNAWGTIEEIVRWLDDSSTLATETEKLLRIMKLTEEAGEVTQAVIGTLGQNPRKGFTHTWEDVQAELCDVIVTAMVALSTLTPDARETFNGHLARVASRSHGTPRAAAASS